ncbi:MAG: ABC transporter permease subunit [Desulfurococcales archaeon]|nr:ABC transporter permease subunit [Desulfurococcales archaeon]
MARILQAVIAVLAAATLLIVLSPLLLVTQDAAARVLGDPRFQRSILLSLATAAASATLAIALATPVSYYLSRHTSRTARLVSSLHLLLLGLPPVGLGISMLIALTRYPLLGEASRSLGLVFTAKSIILAQTVVVSPLAVSLLTGIFNYIPQRIEEQARAYGATRLYTFTRVILRVAAPGIAGAWILAFFRALGEFGATLVLAGNTPGYTETLPIAMYNMAALADLEAASILLTITVLLGMTLITIYTITQTQLEKRLKEI